MSSPDDDAVRIERLKPGHGTQSLLDVERETREEFQLLHVSDDLW